MKYLVTARSWSSDMQSQFGKSDTFHELSDSDIVSAMLKYGRADIAQIEDHRVIDFQNDYDLGIQNVRLVR